jgi:acyl dehydratase
MTSLYLEDFQPGQTFDLGSRVITRDEIVAFARQFDPQPFHLDEEAALSSPFGGLIASGWHTAATFMRLYVDNLLSGAASMGSPGVEQLRWLAPVRPGDELSARFVIESVTPSSKRADRGTVFFHGEMHNQDGVLVMRLSGRGYFGRRNAAVSPAAPPG